MTVEPPENASEEASAGEAGEITFEVEFDDESVVLAVLGGGEEVVLEAVEGEESTFAFAARVRIGDEVVVPPAVRFLVEVVMDDAVAEGGGEDFSNDGVFNDESGAAARRVVASEEVVLEGKEVFGGVKLKIMNVEMVAFTLAGSEVGGVEVG